MHHIHTDTYIHHTSFSILLSVTYIHTYIHTYILIIHMIYTIYMMHIIYIKCTLHNYIYNIIYVLYIIYIVYRIYMHACIRYLQTYTQHNTHNHTVIQCHIHMLHTRVHTYTPTYTHASMHTRTSHACVAYLRCGDAFAFVPLSTFCTSWLCCRLPVHSSNCCTPWSAWL